jgi:GNAT superfamily N-acetyltransferase
VNDPRARIARFSSTDHDVTEFSCGNEMLDRWLVRNAGQSQRRDAARTFVALTGSDSVAGYYTLVAGHIRHDEATAAVRKGLSRHLPIPVAVIARLAVNQRSQGEGIGARLLADALARASRAAEDVAVRAVIVQAIDDRAATFYERFGFRGNTVTPRTLMVTLAELRAAGYGA